MEGCGSHWSEGTLHELLKEQLNSWLSSMMLIIGFPLYTAFNMTTEYWWKHFLLRAPNYNSKVKQMLEKNDEWLKALRFHFTCVLNYQYLHCNLENWKNHNLHFIPAFAAIHSFRLSQDVWGGKSTHIPSSNSTGDQEPGRRIFEKRMRRGRAIERIGEKMRPGEALLHKSVWLHLEQVWKLTQVQL